MSDPKTTTPAEREAAGVETMELVWRDHTLTLPASAEDWPIRVTEAYEQGKGATAVHMLVGDKVWAEFDRKGYRAKDLSDLSEAIVRGVGLGSSGE